MIIKASTRGNATALARHLLNDRDNDQIEQHEVRGFMADDVMGAMNEQHAIGRGVKSRQTLFSVSLSPPPDRRVDVAVFEKAIDDIELSVGLKDQPRVVIFHEKEGRRHAHAVWSRIDPERMTAIPLPFYKRKLMEISRDIYLEQGWKLPQGYIDREDRDPRNFDLQTYQQAKREGRDPKLISALAKQAWAQAQDPRDFRDRMERIGLFMAKGDSRSHVVVNWRGDIQALPRLLQIKTRDVRAKLGDIDAMDLPGLAQVRSDIARTLAPTLQRIIGEAQKRHAEELGPIEIERLSMGAYHSAERQRLDAAIARRQEEEQRQRAERMRHGLAGLLDRLTGRYAKRREQNEREAWAGVLRDREQRQRLVDAQLAERRQLQQRILGIRKDHHERVAELQRDLGQHVNADQSPQRGEREQWLKDQQRKEEAERVRQLDEQRRIEDQEREAWLAKQQATARHVEPDRDEDRLSWLFEQQQRPTPKDIERTQRDLTPDFNERKKWLEQDSDRPKRDLDRGPDIG